MNKLHYHITVSDCTTEELISLCKTVKAKPTSIDLTKDIRKQTDRMLTKYHRDTSVVDERIKNDVKNITAEGFKVLRVKLEEEVDSFTEEDLSRGKYLEAHLKVNYRDDLPSVKGFMMSGNQSDKGTIFYNTRCRDKSDIDNFHKGLIVIEHIGIVESQLEVVLQDSNEQHDRWWG